MLPFFFVFLFIVFLLHSRSKQISPTSIWLTNWEFFLGKFHEESTTKGWNRKIDKDAIKHKHDFKQKCNKQSFLGLTYSHSTYRKINHCLVLLKLNEIYTDKYSLLRKTMSFSYSLHWRAWSLLRKSKVSTKCKMTFGKRIIGNGFKKFYFDL